MSSTNPMVLCTAENTGEIAIKFKQRFAAEYLRNNKTSGAKNLRCFPHCSSTHNVFGFCGQSIKAQLKIVINEDAPLVDIYQLVAVGEFQPRSSEYDALPELVDTESILEFTTGAETEFYLAAINIVASTSFFSKSAGPDPVFNPWHSKRQYTIDLEFKAKTWNYLWMGNRHKTDVDHTFVISIFAPADIYSGTISQHEISVCGEGGRGEGSFGIGAMEDEITTPRRHTLRRLAQMHGPTFKMSCIRRGVKELDDERCGVEDRELETLGRLFIPVHAGLSSPCQGVKQRASHHASAIAIAAAEESARWESAAGGGMVVSPTPFHVASRRGAPRQREREIEIEAAPTTPVSSARTTATCTPVKPSKAKGRPRSVLRSQTRPKSTTLQWIDSNGIDSATSSSQKTRQSWPITEFNEWGAHNPVSSHLRSSSSQSASAFYDVQPRSHIPRRYANLARNLTAEMMAADSLSADEAAKLTGASLTMNEFDDDEDFCRDDTLTQLDFCQDDTGTQLAGQRAVDAFGTTSDDFLTCCRPIARLPPAVPQDRPIRPASIWSERGIVSRCGSDVSDDFFANLFAFGARNEAVTVLHDSRHNQPVKRQRRASPSAGAGTIKEQQQQQQQQQQYQQQQYQQQLSILPPTPPPNAHTTLSCPSHRHQYNQVKQNGRGARRGLLDESCMDDGGVCLDLDLCLSMAHEDNTDMSHVISSEQLAFGDQELDMDLGFLEYSESGADLLAGICAAEESIRKERPASPSQAASSLLWSPSPYAAHLHIITPDQHNLTARAEEDEAMEQEQEQEQELAFPASPLRIGMNNMMLSLPLPAPMLLSPDTRVRWMPQQRAEPHQEHWCRLQPEVGAHSQPQAWNFEEQGSSLRLNNPSTFSKKRGSQTHFQGAAVSADSRIL